MTSDKPADEKNSANTPLSRRDFLRASAVVAATTVVTGCATTGGGRRGPAILPPARLRQRIRVGLVGCGGRGTGAARDCVTSSPNVEIVALGDLFNDRLEEACLELSDLGEKFRVTSDHCYAGFDAYHRVLASDIDLVILATPPGFRPPHLRAAIEAGKHVFMEKPVAVDPVGVRSVIASSELAKAKGLAIVCGTQRRHQAAYLETMKRIHDGAIGSIVGGQCYWNQGELWVKRKEPGWSDMEWQCRNWLYFTWLSGDHIVEQHVHNLDVINWAIGSPPVKCVGMGGRQSRTAPEFGNIFDHFTIEYEYPGGVRVLSMCRQVAGASERVSERLVGTKGTADPHGLIELPKKRRWKYEHKGEPVNPYVQEHADLIASIRSGRLLNEGKRIAESTLTAIMGRMSAYTGREVSWDWVMNASQLDLMPGHCEFSDLACDPVAIPGQTKLV